MPLNLNIYTSFYIMNTAHHMFIVHFEDSSLHTANIQNLSVLVLRFTWQMYLDVGNVIYFEVLKGFVMVLCTCFVLVCMDCFANLGVLHTIKISVSSLT